MGKNVYNGREKEGKSLKKLIIINGTMGVGKSSTSQELMKLLPNSVFLDGDWCWTSYPFTPTEETKSMVMDNITHLLNNFLSCSAYEHIIFCWVMHKEEILRQVLSRLKGDFQAYCFSLVCSEQALVLRLFGDVAEGTRMEDIIERSVPRLQNYWDMDTEKIDVTSISALEAAMLIQRRVEKGQGRWKEN